MIIMFLATLIFNPPAQILIITLDNIGLFLLNILKKYQNWKLIIHLILLLLISSTSSFKCNQIKEWSPEKKRIAVLPFEKSGLSSEDKWLALGAEEIIFEYLKANSGASVLVYDLDNLRKIIRQDSLTKQNYLLKFAQKVKLDYFISGRIIDSSSANYHLRYCLTSLRSGVIKSEAVNFRNLKEMHAIGLIIANNLIKTLPSVKNGLLKDDRAQDDLATMYFFQAKELLFDNKIEDARQLLNKAILNYPEDAKNYALIGKCFLLESAKLQTQGKSIQPFIEKAGFFLNAAVRMDSNNTTFRHNLTQYYIFTHNWIAAEKQILKAYRLNPDEPELYVLMAKLNPSRFAIIGFKNEIELLEHALFLNPGYISAALSLSKYYVDYLQDPHAAINLIQRVLTINPEQPDLLTELGRLYVMNGEFLEIVPVFEKIIKIAPLNSNAFYNLGIYYYNQKDYQNAIRLFERAIEIDSHLEAYLYLGYIFEQLASEETDSQHRQVYLDKAIEYLRYRVKHKRDSTDKYAEIARIHLFNLLNK